MNHLGSDTLRDLCKQCSYLDKSFGSHAWNENETHAWKEGALSFCSCTVLLLKRLKQSGLSKVATQNYKTTFGLSWK